MNADLIHDTAMKYALSHSAESLDEAVRAALPLTYAIASRFSGRGIETEDLRQVAAMALVGALKSFEPDRGLRFTTYVTPTITGKVRNYIRDKAQIMRSPRGLKEQAAKMDRAQEDLTQRLRREPTAQEVASALGWTIEQVLNVQSMREKTTVSSLNLPDENGLPLFDKIGEDDQQLESFESHEDLRRAMSILSATEKKLLNLRFVKRESQSAVASRLNMTQMQVSRMERRILQTLKAEMLKD